MTTRPIHFVKMQGAGNDYVYIDCFAEPTPAHPAALAMRIADRHFGVGGDGLVLVMPSAVAAARMRMFNADGSESEMCGTGVRCVAHLVVARGRGAGARSHDQASSATSSTCGGPITAPPTRTRLAPHSTATSKSPLMPIDRMLKCSPPAPVWRMSS